MNISIYTDGGARGNPGPAGFGVVIYDEKKSIIFKNAVYLGTKTNNEAEYLGLINALEWANNNKDNFKIDRIVYYSDSQLLVRQMQGLYNVKAPNLKPLFHQAQSLVAQIALPIVFNDVRREYNELADELANSAMDKKQ